MRRDPFPREVIVAAAFGLAAWVITAALTQVVFWIASARVAYAAQIMLAPPVALAIALVYFRRREALHPALAATIIGAVALIATLALDAAFDRRAKAPLGAVIAVWFPVALTTIATLMVGLGASQPPRETGSPPATD